MTQPILDRSRDDAPKPGPCAFYRVGEHAVGGWARDPERPDRRLVVDIRVDGETIALTQAESFVPELRQLFGGDGCHGFVVLLDPARMAGASRVEAYLANAETCLGAIRLDGAADAELVATGRIAGELRWSGGLRLNGWACDVATPTQPVPVQVLVDGEPLVEALPMRWRESQPGDPVPSGRFAFDACLPVRFADGRVHTVRALAGGVELAGSPCIVLVHELGFQGLAAELDPADRTGHLLRTQLLDRLMPSAVPLGEFEAWQARFPVDPPGPSDLLTAVLVVGDVEPAISRTLDSVEAQSGDGWFAVSLAASDWTFSPDALAAAAAEIRDGGAQAILVVEAGTLLHRDAVAHLAAAIEHPGMPGLVYCDTIVPGPGGRATPSLKPVFDRPRMTAQAYAADCFVMTPEGLDAALDAQASSLPELLLAAIRRCERDGLAIGHLPQLLARLPVREVGARAAALARAAAIDGQERGLPREASPIGNALRPCVALAWPQDARSGPVSIIIPTRDRVDLLEPCLDSLRRISAGVEYEVIIVDNGSVEPQTHAFFERIAGDGVRILPAAMPFNYSRLNNLGIAESRHDLVLFLNNDVEIIEAGWLREMALELQDGSIGAVGATLLWPSRLVQHGGVVLGPHFAAAHAFNDRIDGEGGYDDLLLAPRSQSVVTAACLLMRKADYLSVGGMDELAFPVAFNDVDLCLKLRALGRSILITPRARLLHKESASRGSDHFSHEKRSRARKETSELRARWADMLAADPFYNPNLSLDLYPFSGLATPPRERRLRFDPFAASSS
jgi:GT2 family glycosyltransferase